MGDRTVTERAAAYLFEYDGECVLFGSPLEDCVTCSLHVPINDEEGETGK